MVTTPTCTEPVNTEYYQKKWVWAVERQRMQLKQSIQSKVDDPIEEVPEMKENSEAIRKGTNADAS